MSDKQVGNPRDVAEWVRRMPLPAPRSTRDVFHLLAQFDSHAGLDALLDRIDFAGVTPALISQAVMGTPLRDRHLAVPGPDFDPRAAFQAALLSPAFRGSILPTYLGAFPDLGRDIFIHVPKCAGTDLVMNLGRRQMPLPSVLEVPGWLSDTEFLEVVGGLTRMRPFQSRVFVYGHMEFATYLDRCGLRPGDRVFSIIRDPIALMVSQANYAIGRLRQDPNGEDPDTAHTRAHLGISRVPPTINDRDLKDLVVQALLNPDIAYANQACRHLASTETLTAEAAIDMVVANDVEITTTERYDRWLRERWGIPRSERHNRSDQILTLHEARRLYAAAMFAQTQEDQVLFDLITWALEQTNTASITGQRLAALVGRRDIVSFARDLTRDRQALRESGARGVFVMAETPNIARYLTLPGLLAEGSPRVETIFNAGFGAEGTAGSLLRQGWSQPEPAFTWTVGHTSVLDLPPLGRDGGALVVQFTLRPFVWRDKLPAQLVEITVNGTAIGTAEIREPSVLEFELPSSLVGPDTPLEITLGLPLASAPRPLSGANDDRVLGLCMERLTIRHLRPDDTHQEHA